MLGMDHSPGFLKLVNEARPSVKEITIEDPGAFRKPWKIRDVWDFAPGEEIAEYICHENEKDVSHLK